MQRVNIASISSIGSAIVIVLATCLCSLTPRSSLPFVGMRLCSPVWLMCLRYEIALIGKIFATNFQLDTTCKLYGSVSLMVICCLVKFFMCIMYIVIANFLALLVMYLAAVLWAALKFLIQSHAGLQNTKKND